MHIQGFRRHSAPDEGAIDHVAVCGNELENTATAKPGSQVYRGFPGVSESPDERGSTTATPID
jgi:hypothetical protein